MTGAVAFSMDTAPGLPSQAPTEQEQWEVFRDAFAMPRGTRRPRPWERSSVPAYAPRLQGQKIWKKAGIQIRNGKENEATLVELQSEGNGSRKKRKVHAAKENIGDARWTSKVSALEPLVHKENDGERNNGDDTAPEGHDDGEDTAIRFVPRKRTNTDHVITPRKPLRQTQLNSRAQKIPMAPSEALDNIFTRRRKSLRRSSIRKSTSSRASARFSSGYGPSFFPEESSITCIPIEQPPPEATSQFMFGSEIQVIDSFPAQNELDLKGPPTIKVVSDNDKIEADIKGPPSDSEMEGSNARKRLSIRRDSKRGSRSSASLASISEDLPVQLEPMVENTESGLISSHDLQDLTSSAPTFGDQSTEKTSKTTPLCAVPEVSESAPPTENHSAHLPSVEHTEKDLPAALSSSESIDTLSDVNRESSPGSPSEQLQREVSQGQHQMIWPTAVEAPSEYTTRLWDEGLRASKTSEFSTQAALEDASTLDNITIAAETSQLFPTDCTAATSVPPITEYASSTGYEDDDTDMLRKFLTRVKANKAAKAENTTPKRKRSLPHSPLRLPLGEIDANASPSPLSLKPKEESTGILPSPSPKRRKRNDSTMDNGEPGEPKAIRRSGRTRLPVKSTPGAPSLIPVRRLGPDGDSTVTIRRTEEKDIAALTRVNTRKNKGALGPTEVLLLKAAEKTDPALKQRLLKEMFAEKQKKGDKTERSKSVTWAKELVQFQSEKKSSNDREKTASISARKPDPVRVGSSKSKISVSRAVNGTPAPKRRARERP